MPIWPRHFPDDLTSQRVLRTIVRSNSPQKALPPIAIAPGPTETELFRANNPQGSEGEARYLTRIRDAPVCTTRGDCGGNSISCFRASCLHHWADAVCGWRRKSRWFLQDLALKSNPVVAPLGVEPAYGDAMPLRVKESDVWTSGELRFH